MKEESEVRTYEVLKRVDQDRERWKTLLFSSYSYNTVIKLTSPKDTVTIVSVRWRINRLTSATIFKSL